MTFDLCGEYGDPDDNPKYKDILMNLVQQVG